MKNVLGKNVVMFYLAFVLGMAMVPFSQASYDTEAGSPCIIHCCNSGAVLTADDMLSENCYIVAYMIEHGFLTESDTITSVETTVEGIWVVNFIFDGVPEHLRDFMEDTFLPGANPVVNGTITVQRFIPGYMETSPHAVSVAPHCAHRWTDPQYLYTRSDGACSVFCGIWVRRYIQQCVLCGSFLWTSNVGYARHAWEIIGWDGPTQFWWCSICGATTSSYRR